MIDERARTILLSAYWSSAGWRPTPMVAPDDLAYAMRAGYLFQPTVLSHDQVIARLHAAIGHVSPETVAAGFLTSLSSRRLEWRSALGSFAVGRHLTLHPFAANVSGRCRVCGLLPAEEYDWSILNFERHKWGGVRHDNPAYIAFDLDQFARFDPPAPTAADAGIFRAVLDAARRLEPSAGPRHLERALMPILVSNQYERRFLIEILGFCGILQPAEPPGFFYEFPPRQDRRCALAHGNFAYPVCWWRGSDGVDTTALAFYFPAFAQ